MMTGTMTAAAWGAARGIAAADTEKKVDLEKVPCPNCDGETFLPILAGHDSLTGIGGAFKLVRCAKCDLVLTNPRPTPQSLGLFYPEEYPNYQSETTARERWHWLEHLILRSRYGHPPQPVNLWQKLVATVGLTKFHAAHQRHEWIPFRA